MLLRGKEISFWVVLLNVLSLIFLAALAIEAFLHREIRSALQLGYSAFTAFVWSFSSFMELCVPGFEQKLFWRNMTQFGTFLLPVAVFAFSLSYAKVGRKMRFRLLSPIVVIACVSIMLIWTDSFSHSMREAVSLQVSPGGFSAISVKQTILGQILVSVNFAVTMAGLFVLAIFALRQSRSGRFAAWVALLGIFIPLFFTFLKNQLGPQSFGGVPASIAFVLGVGTILLGILRARLLGLGSIGRDRAFEVIDEGILVLDTKARLVDVNAAGHRMLLHWLSLPETSSLEEISLAFRNKMQPDKKQALIGGQEIRIELPRLGHELPIFLSLRVHCLQDSHELSGYTLVLRDVTAETNRLSELLQRAERDPLTQAYNKAAFGEIVSEMIAKAESGGCLVLFDVDRFKEINDLRGHLAGDAALRGISDLCRESLREKDVFGRVGGDEFALFLVGASEGDALTLAERLRARIAGAVFESGGETLKATISIGAAYSAGPDESFEELFERADQALYRSKADGRDRVSIAVPD